MGAQAPFFMSKDHSHYSPELTAALHRFQDMYTTYLKMTTSTSLRTNYQRLDPIQSVWDQFVQLRKKETGYGYYTPPGGLKK